MIPFLKPPVTVPVISAVQAGVWTDTYASSRLTDVICWTQTTANVSDEAFGLEVRGESMTNPHGLPSIPEGSIVIVEPHYGQLDDLYGKIVVAMLDGSTEATVKSWFGIVHMPISCLLTRFSNQFRSMETVELLAE